MFPFATQYSCFLLPSILPEDKNKKKFFIFSVGVHQRPSTQVTRHYGPCTMPARPSASCASILVQRPEPAWICGRNRGVRNLEKREKSAVNISRSFPSQSEAMESQRSLRQWKTHDGSLTVRSANNTKC